MKTIRCFLAVKLDLSTVRLVADAQKGLRDTCRDFGMKVAWVPPPNMHITLRFLGQVTEPMAFALKEMLDPVVRDLAPFELAAVGLGAFPDVRTPRTIWVGSGSGADALTALADSVTGRLIEAGFSFDEKPFRPHITIGRVKDGGGDDFSQHLAPLGEVGFGSSIVRNIYCYRSDLNPSGSEYHSLWRLPFGRKWEPPWREAVDSAIQYNDEYQPEDVDTDPEDAGQSNELAGEPYGREPEGSETK